MIVDSAKKKLQVQDIVKNAAQDMDSPYSPQAVFGSIMNELTSPSAVAIQKGNTLFIIHRGEDRKASMRALNADTAKNYLKHCEDIAKQMYNDLGIDEFVSKFSDPALVHIFKYVGRNKPANMGYKVQKTKDGQFQVSAKLGPKRT